MSEQTPNPPAGWYPDPSGGGGQRYWDGAQWTATSPPPPPAAAQPYGSAPAMQPRKKSKTWIIVLAIILGVLLLIGGGCAVLGVVVFNKASEAIDPAKNSQTGLSDGRYLMDPMATLSVNDRCSFTGAAVSAATGETAADSVTVVGEGSVCGSSPSDASVVAFRVKNGVATVVQVE